MLYNHKLISNPDSSNITETEKLIKNLCTMSEVRKKAVRSLAIFINYNLFFSKGPFNPDFPSEFYKVIKAARKLTYEALKNVFYSSQNNLCSSAM